MASPRKPAYVSGVRCGLAQTDHLGLHERGSQLVSRATKSRPFGEVLASCRSAPLAGVDPGCSEASFAGVSDLPLTFGGLLIAVTHRDGPAVPLPAKAAGQG